MLEGECEADSRKNRLSLDAEGRMRGR